MSVDKLLKLVNQNLDNAAESVDDDTLESIARECMEGYRSDYGSVQDYMDRLDKGIKLATQVVENKTNPWPGCFTLDTEVLTETGWKSVVDVNIGERVFTRNREHESYYAPVTDTQFGYTNDLVHFKGKSIDLKVTPNHNMLLEDKSGRTYFRQARDFFKQNDVGYIPLTSNYIREGASGLREKSSTDLIALGRLIGWYLAEGYACYGNNSYTTVGGEFRDYGTSTSSFVICQSLKANPEKYEILRKDIEDCGFSYSENERGFIIHAKSMDEATKKLLRSLGNKYTKYIPRELLEAPRDFLESLLDRAVLGDGHTAKNGHSVYWSVSKQLIDDLQELCQRIGIRATIKNEGRNTGMIRGREIVSTTDIFSLSINRKSRVQTAKLNREWLKVEDTPIACVTTKPEHTIYVRRNGIAVWCGNSANVKYPLVTEGALRFSAEAYPALIDSSQPVKARVIGEDPDGEKTNSASRVSKHMSYQVLEKMETWEEDMDELLILVSIVGTMFKKTYFDGIQPKSDVISPRDLIVNYYTRKLEESPRITHKLYFSPNEVIEKQRRGQWLDVELQKPETPEKDAKNNDRRTGERPPENNEDTPHTILEMHTRYDLDGDGYKEPWIITLDELSEKVLRIMPRFDTVGIEDSIEADANDEIIKIHPDQYFTKFTFIPNPDRSVYGLGLYHIAGPLNEAANTIINQLLDAGTLSNLQSGFISKGLRIRGGEKRFKPGEWKLVNASLDDIKKGLFPLPVREPSNVLYQLLGTIIQSGQRLVSTQDALAGDSQQHNQKTGASYANIEQGMKVFNGIYKRLHRALKKELKKIYKINSETLEEQEYFAVLDAEPETPQGQQQSPEQMAGQLRRVLRSDYNPKAVDVVPTSDPNVVTEQQKLQKASALFDMAQQGLVNQTEATKRILEAQNQPGIEQLMDVPPAQPTFEQQIEQEKLKLESAKLQAEIIKDESEQRINALTAEAKAIRDIAEAEGVETGQQMERYKAIIELIRDEGKEAVELQKIRS